MPLSCGDGHHDCDSGPFREGAYPDGDPHKADRLRPQHGACPAALGEGTRWSDRHVPGPGRVNLECHGDAINREPRPVLHAYDQGGVLPPEDRVRGFKCNTIAHV